MGGSRGRGGHGYGAVVETVIGNPVFTMNSLLEPEKFLYLVQLAAPLCFFPGGAARSATCYRSRVFSLRYWARTTRRLFKSHFNTPRIEPRSGSSRWSQTWSGFACLAPSRR